MKVGSPLTFAAAVLVVTFWAASGFFVGFSDTWQLVINPVTTIITFLIHNTQNRDSRALHMKLDELIIYTQGADNRFITLENLSNEQIDHIEQRIHSLSRTSGDGNNDIEITSELEYDLADKSPKQPRLRVSPEASALLKAASERQRQEV